MKINWTDNAIQDLKEIKAYISKDSEFYANRHTLDQKFGSRAYTLLLFCLCVVGGISIYSPSWHGIKIGLAANFTWPFGNGRGAI